MGIAHWDKRRNVSRRVAENAEKKIRVLTQMTQRRRTGRSTLDLTWKVIWGGPSLQEKIGIYINKLRSNTTLHPSPFTYYSGHASGVMSRASEKNTGSTREKDFLQNDVWQND